MRHCPCKNCISLAICREPDEIIIEIIHERIKTCELLYEYLQVEKITYDGIQTELDHTDLFNRIACVDKYLGDRNR